MKQLKRSKLLGTVCFNSQYSSHLYQRPFQKSKPTFLHQIIPANLLLRIPCSTSYHPLHSPHENWLPITSKFYLLGAMILPESGHVAFLRVEKRTFQ